ncbi:MAG: ClpX C4-type zinc finger protein [Acidimicrobiales bacterium]
MEEISGPQRCSFCTAPAGAVDVLVHGPGTHICERCIGICNDVLAERSQETGPAAEASVAAGVFARANPAELDAVARSRLARAAAISRELAGILEDLIGR